MRSVSIEAEWNAEHLSGQLVCVCVFSASPPPTTGPTVIQPLMAAARQAMMATECYGAAGSCGSKASSRLTSGSEDS